MAEASEELPTASGTIMTQITCPDCTNVFDVEGDAEGDEVECPDCEAKMIVRRT